MIEIRWHGRGGQGAFTASKILGDAARKGKKYALSFPSFGPERRGAPIQAYTKIDTEKIADRSVLKKADYIIYLDETLFQESVYGDLKEGGIIFLNTKSPKNYADQSKVVAFDANGISERILKRPVSNTAMLAILAIKTKIVEVEHIKSSLEEFLAPKIAAKNKELIEKIVEAVQAND